MEGVPGHALGMDPDKDVGGPCHAAFDQGDVVLVVDEGAVADDGEVPVGGRKRRLDHPLDEHVMGSAVGDQIGDGDHFERVAGAVADQVRDPSHGAVVVHHLADDPGGDETGQAGKVHRGLRLAGPLQHPASFGLEREDVSGLDEVGRAGLGVDGDLDGASPVSGGDPGGDALARFDRHGEGSLEAGLVLGRHEVQAKLVATLRSKG